MKSLGRNVAIAVFIAFAIGLIYGCAEKPITFAGPGVQIWKLNFVYDDGNTVKDQTLVLKPSETEKDLFHVTATIDTEIESDMWGNARVFLEWKGEIRNGAMTCNITGNRSLIRRSGGANLFGEAKGTFSKRRTSGTFQYGGFMRYGKWTAERIS